MAFPSSPIKRLPLHKLKCCPLCQSVNAVSHTECFVCGWSGAFDHDEATIREGLRQLVLQCPELHSVLEKKVFERQTILERMLAFLRGSRRGGVDYRA